MHIYIYDMILHLPRIRASSIAISWRLFNYYSSNAIISTSIKNNNNKKNYYYNKDTDRPTTTMTSIDLLSSLYSDPESRSQLISEVLSSNPKLRFSLAACGGAEVGTQYIY